MKSGAATKECLIIDDLHLSIVQGLEMLGYAVDYRPDIERQEILKVIGHYDGIIVRSKMHLDREFFEAATRLKFIARAGAGLDQIDVAEAYDRGVAIVNAPEGNRDALAEHCIGLILCLLNKIHLGHRQIQEGTWNREGNRGVEIGGKTVGIIGYGNMGRAFAERLQGFGCKVLAYDKYKSGFSDEHVEEVVLQGIFDKCNIVSFHVPLTEETRGMANAGFISNFRNNIYLINTARGEVLPLGDLKEQLVKGKILGAALDVHEFEKRKSLTSDEKELFHFFQTAENVLLTPHVGGWSYESYQKISEVLVAKIRQLQL